MPKRTKNKNFKINKMTEGYIFYPLSMTINL